MCTEKRKEYKKQYYQDNKEKRKQYLQDNKEAIAANNKEYRQDNKEHIEQYRKDNKEAKSIYMKQYYQDNKQTRAEARKQYRQDNKEETSKYHKQYNQDNKETIAEKKKQYWQDNKEIILEYRKQYRQDNNKIIVEREKNRRQTDINFRLLGNCRSRLNHAIKGNSKSLSIKELLGCTIEHLKQHLEKQFTGGMTWDNQGFCGWHIDHIIPCSSFNMESKEEQRQCFHYTNLQPLWAEDNLRKSNKIGEQNERV